MPSLETTSFTTQQLRRGVILLAAIVVLRAVLVGTFWTQPDPATDPFGFGLLVLVAFLVGSVGIVYFGFTRWVGVDLKAWWIDPDELRGDLLWGVAGVVVVFVVLGVFALVMMFGLGMEPPEQVPPSAVGFVLILVFGFLIQRENPALPVSDESSDTQSEPRNEQGGSESRKLCATNHSVSPC